MAYFEFEYFDEAHAPVVADMYANSESPSHRTRIGQIDQPNGVEFRANLYGLPGASIRSFDTKRDAASAMLDEADCWLRRMNLTRA